VPWHAPCSDPSPASSPPTLAGTSRPATARSPTPYRTGLTRPEHEGSFAQRRAPGLQPHQVPLTGRGGRRQGWDDRPTATSVQSSPERGHSRQASL
jgi:hypothetical protein